MNAYAAVFFELEYNYEGEVYDDHMLAQAYSLHSEPCLKKAQKLAKRDELEAMKLHEIQKLAKSGKFFGGVIKRLFGPKPQAT